MPAPINPALVIAGPAVIFHRGKTFRSQGNITATPQLDTFNVQTSRFGVIEERESTLTMQVKFTPEGTLDALSVLWPYALANPGELIHRCRTLGAIDLESGAVTCVGHGYREGAMVRLASWGTLPAGWSADTLYYLHSLSADTFSLHASAADAAAGADPVVPADAGAGAHRIIEQETLVVWTYTGEVFTFHNAALPSMPDLTASAVATVVGETTFECFRKFGVVSTDAVSFYTRSSAPLVDAGEDPANIVTQAYGFSWGAAAPWSAMDTTQGVKVSFSLDTDPLVTDAGGLLSRRITQLGATLTARPVNVDADSLLAKLGLQGAGAGRGRRLTGTDPLKVDGAGLYVRLYGAFLKNPALNFDRAEDRAGDLTWTATRTWSAGAPNPLWYVGAANPDA